MPQANEFTFRLCDARMIMTLCMCVCVCLCLSVRVCILGKAALLCQGVWSFCGIRMTMNRQHGTTFRMRGVQLRGVRLHSECVDDNFQSCQVSPVPSTITGSGVGSSSSLLLRSSQSSGEAFIHGSWIRTALSQPHGCLCMRERVKSLSVAWYPES